MSLSNLHSCLIFSFCCSEIFKTDAESSISAAEAAKSKLKESYQDSLIKQIQIMLKSIFYCFFSPPLYTNFVFCETVILAKYVA